MFWYNGGMKFFLASDHAGFALKQALVVLLKEKGNEVVDMGPAEMIEGDDYPDLCIPLAKAVAAEKGSFGIVVGKSGVGEAIAANRVKGARAVVYCGGNTQLLKLSREDNDANVISFGADFVGIDEAGKMIDAWSQTVFSGEERHVRRIGELDL